MIRSIRARILCNGNLVKEAARPATVARYLSKVEQLADYRVSYWIAPQVHRVTGEGFLALYEGGRIPEPQPLHRRQAHPGHNALRHGPRPEGQERCFLTTPASWVEEAASERKRRDVHAEP